MTPDEVMVDSEGEELTLEDWNDVREEAKRSLYFTSLAICKYEQTNPRVHLAFSEFLQDDTVLNKCALMPRDHRKTTVGTKAGLIHRIIKDANVRILLGNEVKDNAELMLGEIKWHFEHNDTFRYFFPELIPANFRKTTWSNEEILVPREAGWSEPTISVVGMGGTKVSTHYDHLHFDDIIGLAALQSPTEMKKAIQWLNYSRGLKVSSYTTTTTLMGTRWDLKDVYEHAVKNMGFKEFRRGALVLGENGPEPFYPEVISMEELEAIITSDPFQWATNYANNPYDAANSDLKPEWLKGQDFWLAPDGDLRYRGANGELHLQRYEELRFYLHIDPSMGETDNSNETAFVLVGVAHTGLVFIFEAWKKRIDPVKTVDHVFDYQDTFVPYKTTVEGVAYQKALVYFINDRAKRERRYVNIESFLPGTRRDKITRIRFTLQPYFRDRRIFFRANQFQLVDEYNTFGRAHPDILDALSQGPSVWQFPADEKSVQRKRRKLDAMLSNRGTTGYGI